MVVVVVLLLMVIMRVIVMVLMVMLVMREMVERVTCRCPKHSLAAYPEQGVVVMVLHVL